MKLIDSDAHVLDIMVNSPGLREEVESILYTKKMVMTLGKWEPGRHGSWTCLAESRRLIYQSLCTREYVYGVSLSRTSSGTVEKWNWPLAGWVGHPTVDEVLGFVDKEDEACN